MVRKKKIILTDMFKRYLVKFAIRLFIFFAILFAYITQKEILYGFMTHEFTFGVIEYGISPLHVLWLGFMVMMIMHLFPNKKLSMALKKNKEENWVEEISLKEAMKRLNEREYHIIKMRFFEGKTQTEVAEEIAISQAQVSRLEKHALKSMKQYLS